MSYKKTIAVMILSFAALLTASAQTALKKVYDEQINPLQQIDQAVARARAEGKYVICQVGGNWCPWCLRFADFIEKTDTISKVVNDNFVYIHVNYNRRRSKSAAMNETSPIAVTNGPQSSAVTNGVQQADASGTLQSDPALLAQQTRQMLERLHHPERFGFPVFVVLDADGTVLHIQDSSFLEEGQGYDQSKVLRFFCNWTPKSVNNK